MVFYFRGHLVIEIEERQVMFALFYGKYKLDPSSFHPFRSARSKMKLNRIEKWRRETEPSVTDLTMCTSYSNRGGVPSRRKTRNEGGKGKVGRGQLSENFLFPLSKKWIPSSFNNNFIKFYFVFSSHERKGLLIQIHRSMLLS